MSDYTPIFQAAAQQYNLDPDFLRAVSMQESRLNPTAVSRAGAAGLMGLMPPTAKDMGVTNILDPQQNIMGGAKYLRQMIDKYGNLDDALSAYNWGPGNFDKYKAGQIKQMPNETAQYPDLVAGHFGKIKQNAGFVQAPQPQATQVPADGDDPIIAALSGKSAPHPADTPASPAEDPILAALSGKPAAAPGPQTPAPAASVAPTLFDETARQVGLTGRAAVTGLTALPAMLGDALNTGINYGIRGINAVHDALTSPSLSELVTGRKPWIPELQMPSQVIQEGMNAAGVPQPQNATERVVQDVAGSMAGVAPSVGLGNALARAASPAAAAVGRGLAAMPGMQIAGAAGAAGAGGGAKEAGFGPGAQIGAGVLGGMAGVLGASGATAAARGLANAFSRGVPMTAEQAQAAAQSGVAKVLGDMGDAGRMVAPEQVQALEQQVAAQLQRTGKVDPAALMRSQDFAELGIQPTLGQVTRDAGQFAKERNVRGLESLGDRLLQRFSDQNQRLQGVVSGLRGNPAEPFQAGEALSNALQGVDERMRQQVSAAYQAARQSSGKDLNVPLTGLAQDYANVLQNFAEKVPGGVRNAFESLGLQSGTQRKVFSVDDAENLLKVINNNMGNDRATNTALGQLRDAVKNAVLSADDQGGVYANARRLAAQRFQLQDAIPALKAAADGTVAPDDFVRRFVVQGKTNDVRQLAKLLKQNSPEAFQEARAQIGNELSRAAFGTNAAGDTVFSPNRYAEGLRRLGSQKLSAFYSPEEVDQIQRVGRVGAYINSQPAASPVNNSNTAGAMASMIGGLTSKVPVIHPLGTALQKYANKQFVDAALAAQLPRGGASVITPQEAALASRLMLYSTPRTPPRN